jgi:hypothetical protein
MQSGINIRTFTGSSIKPYLASIARLRIEIFREFPYLWKKESKDETSFLRKYLQTNESIGVLVFDGSVLVGVSTGIPLEFESRDVQKNFVSNKLPVSSYFFFGESLLLKEYRRRGIGHHFFDLREAHAGQLKRFSHICFYAIARKEDDPRKPEDYMPLHDFWRKRGYAPQKDFSMIISWKDIGDEKESQKNMLLWMKKLPLLKKVK